MATAIQVPDFVFSGFYYPEILEDLTTYMQENVPELTEDDPTDPYIQLIRAFALSCHLNNVLLDAVAKERFFETCELRQSIRSHLRLIGYRLKQLSPSSADMVARYNNRLASVPNIVVPPLALFSTSSEDPNTPSVEYEAQDGFVIEQRTDKVGHVLSHDGSSDTDNTTEAQSPTGAFTVGWGAAVSAGDKLYVGHKSVMWNRVDFDIEVAATGILHGAWEYYDGSFADGNPTAALVPGDYLRPGDSPVAGKLVFVVDSILGTKNRAGAQVRVRCATTGAYQTLTSSFLSGAPTSVINSGGILTFDLTSLLGTSSQVGIGVVVRCISTGVEKNLAVVYEGGSNKVKTVVGDDPYFGQGSPSTTASAYWIDVGPNIVETTDSNDQDPLLGQGLSPSAVVGDYIVGTDFRELPSVVDETAMLQTVGAQALTFALPQSSVRNWRKAEVNGIAAYWLRFRVVAVASSTTKPQINSVSIDKGSHYILWSVTQGRTVEDSPAGSSNGLANQAFPLANLPVLDTTVRVFVTEPGGVEREYTRVENFLNATSDDRVFTVEVDDIGQGVIRFGGEGTGKVPPPGTDNIRVTYRVASDIDGDAPAGSINVNLSGVAFLDRISNPRKAAGYLPAEGSTAADIERLKDAGPASLRALSRCTTADDAAYLAVNEFVASGGSRPVVRAKGIEGGGGDKTILLVVVGAGGGALSSDAIAELEEFFNGNVEKKKSSIVVANQRVVVQNFVPVAVNVTAKLYGGDKTAVETALIGLLSPVAKGSDSEYVWEFNEEVPESRIKDLLMDTLPKPRKVILEGAGIGTLTSVGTAVTGVDTEFLSQLNVGDEITANDGQVRKVSSITSNLSLVLSVAPSPAWSGASFTFRMGDVPGAQTRLPKKGTVLVTKVE